MPDTDLVPDNLDLPGQFALGLSAATAPASWARSEIGGLPLACHPALPRFTLPAGVILGIPVGDLGEYPIRKASTGSEDAGSPYSTIVCTSMPRERWRRFMRRGLRHQPQWVLL